MDLAAPVQVSPGGLRFFFRLHSLTNTVPAVVVVDPRDLMRLRQIVMCLADGPWAYDKHSYWSTEMETTTCQKTYKTKTEISWMEHI